MSTLVSNKKYLPQSTSRRQLTFGIIFAILGIIISVVLKLSIPKIGLSMFFFGIALNTFIEGKSVFWLRDRLTPPKPISGFWAYFLGVVYLLIGILAYFAV